MIYTFGYQGQSRRQLKAFVLQTGALLVDIRYSANSRNPQWRKEEMRIYFGSDHYRHLPDLGNRNYRKGGAIDISDFQTGYRWLKAASQSYDTIILLCVCSDAERCHRTHVARRLQELDMPTAELRLGEVAAV